MDPADLKHTDQCRETSAEQDPYDSAHAGDNCGLTEKLGDNVSGPGAQGLADTDLPGPLCHGDEHDVHDADAAHDEGDGCHERHKGCHPVHDCAQHI